MTSLFLFDMELIFFRISALRNVRNAFRIGRSRSSSVDEEERCLVGVGGRQGSLTNGDSSDHVRMRIIRLDIFNNDNIKKENSQINSDVESGGYRVDKHGREVAEGDLVSIDDSPNEDEKRNVSNKKDRNKKSRGSSEKKEKRTMR